MWSTTVEICVCPFREFSTWHCSGFPVVYDTTCCGSCPMAMEGQAVPKADDADAKLLRQARREARKRNIGQNAADRLRRIQGVANAAVVDSHSAQVIAPATSGSSSFAAPMADAGHRGNKMASDPVSLSEHHSATDATAIHGNADKDMMSGGDGRRLDTADAASGSLLKHRHSNQRAGTGEEAPDSNDTLDSPTDGLHDDQPGGSGSGDGGASKPSRQHQQDGEVEADNALSPPEPARIPTCAEVAVSGRWLVLTTLTTILFAALNVADGVAWTHVSPSLQYYWTALTPVCRTVMWMWLLCLLPRLVLRSLSNGVASANAASSQGADVLSSGGGGGSADLASAAMTMLTGSVVPTYVQRAVVCVSWLHGWYNPLALQCAVYAISLITVHQSALHAGVLQPA